MPPLPCAAPKLLLLEVLAVLPVVDHGPLGRLRSSRLRGCSKTQMRDDVLKSLPAPVVNMEADDTLDRIQ
jgi:hypothetical protein